MVTSGTQIGADGRRYPTGTQPTIAADYKRTVVRVRGSLDDGEVPVYDGETDDFVAAVPDTGSLGLPTVVTLGPLGGQIDPEASRFYAIEAGPIPVWEAEHAYTTDPEDGPPVIQVSGTLTSAFYVAIADGVSGAVEPAWDDGSGTFDEGPVVDGTVAWVLIETGSTLGRVVAFPNPTADTPDGAQVTILRPTPASVIPTATSDPIVLGFGPPNTWPIAQRVPMEPDEGVIVTLTFKQWSEDQRAGGDYGAWYPTPPIHWSFLGGRMVPDPYSDLMQGTDEARRLATMHLSQLVHDGGNNDLRWDLPRFRNFDFSPSLDLDGPWDLWASDTETFVCFLPAGPGTAMINLATDEQIAAGFASETEWRSTTGGVRAPGARYYLANRGADDVAFVVGAGVTVIFGDEAPLGQDEWVIVVLVSDESTPGNAGSAQYALLRGGATPV